MTSSSSERPRRPSTFKQRDLTRALKGAIAAGWGVQSVVIDKGGRIVLETSQGRADAESKAVNEWDGAK
jgi:hypothetical protein